jgi:signal transduction histidine kinase
MLLVGIQNWVRNLGLWPRMAFAISIGFLILFVAFSIIGERALQEGTDRLLEERLVIAQMAAAEIDQYLQTAHNELELARRFADFNPRGDSLSGEAHVLSHTYGQIGVFTPGITFIDTTGSVILSQPSNLFSVGTDLTSLPYVAQSLANQESTISDPFLNPLTDQPVVAITVPIFDETKLLGFLSGHIDIRGQEVIEPLNRAASLGHTGHAILVNSKGQSLASTFNAPFLAPGEHAIFYQTALNSREPQVSTVLVNPTLQDEGSNVQHVMAFAALEQAPWGVAVGGEADEAFAGLQRLRVGLTILGTATLLVTWVATLWGTRLLVKPVQQLTEAAQQIADHELEIPLQINAGGEIGAMAKALERMRKLLLSNINDLSFWNETLEERVAERTRELRQHESLIQGLLARAINAQEEERGRLAQELHDGIGQMLTAVQLSIDQLAKIPLNNAEKLVEQRSRLRKLTDQTLTDLRRIISAIRPGVLSELGLLPALEWVADNTLRQADVTVDIESDGYSDRLPDEIEILLFRIAQEAMRNIARHSEANRVDITLKRVDAKVVLTLTDDGKGFEPIEIITSNSEGGGLGLAGMKERAAIVGGQVTINSILGEGTNITVVIPLSTHNLVRND